MTARSLAVVVAVLAVAAATAGAADPQPGDRVTAAARQAWAITDLVLEHDIDPPARQQMLLYGLQALSRQARGRQVPNLGARVSAVTTPEQFAALLAEVWPADTGDSADREEVLYRGLVNRLQGEEHFGGYLSATDRKNYEAIAGNRYVGTGIQIRMSQEAKLAQIVVPFPGGPARRAGARPNDLIVAINDQSTEGLSLREVVRRLQGEEGTEVSMTVRQPGESKTRRLPMVRSVIPFASVEGYRRTGEESWSFRPDPKCEVGYLSFHEIKSSTLQELRLIEPLLREAGVRAVVLDLRFAQGTDIRHAALVADGLLDGGTLWRVRDARGRVKEYRADRDCLFRDVPLAVLVGRHTRGTAAVLAAALQDHGRAIVVGDPAGDPPRGEMLVTSLVPLPDGGGGLLLRTGRVERVTRSDESAVGGVVVPEHRVGLNGDRVQAVLTWMHQQGSPEPKADAKPPADPQLDRAVALLSEALGGARKKDTK